MWYTLGSDWSTLRSEGEVSCRATYGKLRTIFRLPTFEEISEALSGKSPSLAAWAKSTQVNLTQLNSEKKSRERFQLDLVPKGGTESVGSLLCDRAGSLVATFKRVGDAEEVLGQFYPHSGIFYGRSDSEYEAMSIREVLERLRAQ
jgi:hypothetical protein